MRKVSQIAHDTVVVVEQINELKWQLNKAWKNFRILQTELEHYSKYNRTIKLN